MTATSAVGPSTTLLVRVPQKRYLDEITDIVAAAFAGASVGGALGLTISWASGTTVDPTNMISGAKGDEDIGSFALAVLFGGVSGMLYGGLLGAVVAVAGRIPD